MDGVCTKCEEDKYLNLDNTCVTDCEAVNADLHIFVDDSTNKCYDCSVLI